MELVIRAEDHHCQTGRLISPRSIVVCSEIYEDCVYGHSLRVMERKRHNSSLSTLVRGATTVCPWTPVAFPLKVPMSAGFIKTMPSSWCALEVIRTTVIRQDSARLRETIIWRAVWVLKNFSFLSVSCCDPPSLTALPGFHLMTCCRSRV